MINNIFYVVQNSKHVFINKENIVNFVDGFSDDHINHWFNEAPFDILTLPRSQRMTFLLLFNSISFSYWGDPKWTIDYKGKKLDGAYGLIACLARAIDNGFDIFNFHYLQSIPENDFSKILEGNVEIPLFQERLKIIRRLGKIMIEHFDSDVDRLFKNLDSDIALVEKLVNIFPFFEDSSTYKGESVHFLKRAQLLVADLFQSIPDLGLSNIENLTACADYKIPKILRSIGIFHYSEELSKKIDSKVELTPGSEEEVEIRANTIWAVELIKQNLIEKIPSITSIYINDHIWLLSQEKKPSDKPYHLTRTISY